MKKKITWNFLKCIWKQLEGSQEESSPSIPWTSSCELGLGPWTAESMRTLTPCHFFSSLFLPHPPTKAPEISLPQLDTHTHTQSPAARYGFQRTPDSIDSQSGAKASYHGSLAIIASSTSGNGNKCAHVLKGPLGKISGAAWGHNGRLCWRERIWSGKQQ